MSPPRRVRPPRQITVGTRFETLLESGPGRARIQRSDAKSHSDKWVLFTACLTLHVSEAVTSSGQQKARPSDFLVFGTRIGVFLAQSMPAINPLLRD